MNQVGSQGGVGLVANLDIVGVESSSYGLRDALYVGQRPPNGGWCVLRFVCSCGRASLLGCLSDEVFYRGRIVQRSVLRGCYIEYVNEKKGFNTTSFM